MSGHNKWSKIRHKKGTADSRRSQAWTKRIREITVAAKLGGLDTAANARLRTALSSARAANVPKDTIARALKRVEGGDVGDLEELLYEAYGPGGVAMMIACATENRNRTGSEVRSLLKRHQGSLGTSGSVSFMFDAKGQFLFHASSISEETLMELGMQHGADDIQHDDEGWLVYCAPEQFLELSGAFEEAGVEPAEAEVGYFPQTMVKVKGESATVCAKLIDILEGLEDVQNVWTNVEFDSSFLESEEAR